MKHAIPTEIALLLDALHTSLFAQALGDRRLVLLSHLDHEFVEDLHFDYAANSKCNQDVFPSCKLNHLTRASRSDPADILHTIKVPGSLLVSHDTSS